MSNNNLWCSKCRSHHHPVECPLDTQAMTHNPSCRAKAREIVQVKWKGFAGDKKLERELIELITEALEEKEREIKRLNSVLDKALAYRKKGAS